MPSPCRVVLPPDTTAVAGEWIGKSCEKALDILSARDLFSRGEKDSLLTGPFLCVLLQGRLSGGLAERNVISFECSGCGKQLQVKAEFAGLTGKCPSCGATMDIPSREEPAPAYATVAVEQPELDAPAPPAALPRSSGRRTNYEEEEWQPPAGLRNHAGDPLGGNDDFFAAPPPEIGEILSAYTSLRRDRRPMAPGTRLGLAVAVGAAGMVVGLLIALNFQDAFWQLFWPVLLAGLGLLITLAATRFRHTCTFVGRAGIASFRCRGSRE
jgi:hypothetical protein